MDIVRRFLLHAIDAYESRHEMGPTVGELAADLGLPDDFGHKHLVDHLRDEVALDHASYYRGRFAVTTAGRRALDAAEARRPARSEHDARLVERITATR